MDDFNTKICPVCGKEFEVTYPNLWAYRKKGTGIYYCTWKCIQKSREEKKAMTKLSEEQKQEAVRIALNGEAPTKFLGDCGMANPSGTWFNIRKHLDVETLGKIDEAREKRLSREGSKKRYAQKKAQKLKLAAGGNYEISVAEEPEEAEEEAEPARIFVPLAYDGMIVREIEGNFGRYRHSAVGGAVYIDFESADRLDTLSFTIEQWRSFREEQQKAARILGVEL